MRIVIRALDEQMKETEVIVEMRGLPKVGDMVREPSGRTWQIKHEIHDGSVNDPVFRGQIMPTLPA